MDLLDEQLITIKKGLQFRWWVILIWLGLFAIGYLFNIMHWPYNSILRIIAASGFMAYTFSFFFLLKERSALIISCFGLNLLWILTIVWGEFYNDGYPLNTKGIIAHAFAFAILLTIHLIVLKDMKRNQKQ